MSSHIGAPSNSRNYHVLKGSGIRCTPDTFGKDMMNLFQAYSEEVVEGVTWLVGDTADIGVQMLRETIQPSASEGGSAKPMKRREWKKYARSWIADVKDGINFYHVTIRNRSHYRLTHLLEYGHATRDGNRTRAFEHIAPVDEFCVNRLDEGIPKIIEKGGL